MVEANVVNVCTISIKSNHVPIIQSAHNHFYDIAVVDC